MRSFTEFLVDNPKYIPHTIFIILGLLIAFGALMYGLESRSMARAELNLKRMEQCLGAGVSYNDCKFNVYGGIRINLGGNKNEEIK